MRDYKNVTVPKKYRAGKRRTTVRRVTADRGRRHKDASFWGIFAKILVAFIITTGSYLGWKAYRQLTHAEVFMVAGVTVKGVRHLSEDDLKGIADVFTGQNIFTADLESAARQAEALAWVKEVRVHRRLPNRISMVITEREPVAVLDTGKGRYLIDFEGAVIEKAGRDRAALLPAIAARDLRVVPGETLDSDAVFEAMTLLEEISNQGGWRLPEVTIKADALETLTIRYGRNEYRFGAGNYTEKLRRLTEVARDLKRRGMQPSYIDLRPERQAAAMVRSGK